MSASKAPMGIAHARFLRGAAEEASFDEHNGARDAWYWAHEIVRTKLRSDAELRGTRALVAMLLAAEAEGHTALRLQESSLRARARSLGVTPDDLAALLESAQKLGLNHEASAPWISGKSHAPVMVHRDSISSERAHVSESKIAAFVAARVGGSSGHDAPSQHGSSAGGSHALTSEQMDAVARASRARFSIVTGGPGTGKTSIVVGVLRELVAAGMRPEDIALAAPTGRAAARMTTAIRAQLRSGNGVDESLFTSLKEAQTLHRLLSYSPAQRRFLRNENSPLPARMVIVDEASMLDTALAEALVAAVSPDAQLLLLGDAEQLPAVESGAVLRDLLRAKEAGVPITATTLTQSFRMDPNDPNGRSIYLAATAVREGVWRGATARSAVASVRFEGPEWLSADARRGFFERWHKERVVGVAFYDEAARREWQLDAEQSFDEESSQILGRFFSAMESSRLLAVLRETGRETSVAWINDAMHARTRAHFSELSVDAEFLPGEPVMIESNDREHGLSNGDTGVVLRVRWHGATAHQFAAVFRKDAGFAAYPLDRVRARLALGYATTVHKAQGSEFDSVALILPDADVPLLARDLLYTALTRARKSAVVVGDAGLLALAASRVNVRETSLVTKLEEALAKNA